MYKINKITIYYYIHVYISVVFFSYDTTFDLWKRITFRFIPSAIFGIGRSNLKCLTYVRKEGVKCQNWIIIWRKELKLFDVHPFQICEFPYFSTFTFFRVFQYRRIWPENESEFTPQKFNKTEQNWWSSIQGVHRCWTKIRAEAMNRNVNIITAFGKCNSGLYPFVTVRWTRSVYLLVRRYFVCNLRRTKDFSTRTMYLRWHIKALLLTFTPIFLLLDHTKKKFKRPF